MAQAMETGRRGKRGNGDARAALMDRTTDVIEDIATLRKDVSRLADAAGNAARHEVKHAGKRLGALRTDVSERASLLSQSVRERAGDAADYLGEQVRENPGKTIGISLGAGVLLGLLLASRK